MQMLCVLLQENCLGLRHAEVALWPADADFLYIAAGQETAQAGGPACLQGAQAALSRAGQAGQLHVTSGGCSRCHGPQPLQKFVWHQGVVCDASVLGDVSID